VPKWASVVQGAIARSLSQLSGLSRLRITAIPIFLKLWVLHRYSSSRHPPCFLPHTHLHHVSKEAKLRAVCGDTAKSAHVRSKALIASMRTQSNVIRLLRPTGELNMQPRSHQHRLFTMKPGPLYDYGRHKRLTHFTICATY